MRTLPSLLKNIFFQNLTGKNIVYLLQNDKAILVKNKIVDLVLPRTMWRVALFDADLDNVPQHLYYAYCLT